jgi:hypothetical protein
MITNALGRLSWWRFRSACRDPLTAQARRLRGILSAAAGTEVGHRTDFAGLARVDDPVRLIRAYQRRIPVRDPSAMRADLDAVYQGDWRRLCPSPPLWFAMTAGSTGRYKHIPVTAEYRREVGGSSLIFQGALETAFPEVRGGRTQFLVGSAEGGRSPAGVPRGFASGFNYKSLPWLIRRRFVAPYWIFTLDDAEERAYAAGRVLVEEKDLRVLCAISPVNLMNLRRALDRNAERLLADLEAGTLTVEGRSAVPGTWRAPPSPRRARVLAEHWHATGWLPSAALFPSLRVLVCWQGGNMSYYLNELRAAFGIDSTFEFPISASEGVFAIPFRRNQAGGVLAVTSHFFEFLPVDNDSAVPLRADQLVPGREYGIVVTNAAGLYRYDMEDVVRVTGHYRATPVIEFVSKRSRQVSVSNERVTELDVTVAMREASQACDCWVHSFLFVPCSDRRYRVVLDGAGLDASTRPDGARLRALAREVEAQLRRYAKGYDFEREDALLEPLELVVTEPGQLQAYLAGRQPAEALPNAQMKPVHLTDELDAHRRFRAEACHAA